MKSKWKREIAAVCLLLCGTAAMAQYDKEVRAGNDLYKEGKYDEAEVSYRKALDAETEDDKTIGAFNLGDALYKQGRTDEALAQYQMALNGSDDKALQASAWHNLGNTYLQKMQQGKQNPQEAQKAGQYLSKAVDAYKNALRLNPKDSETRYNLAKSLKLQQQQQNQDQQNQDQDQQNDQNEDKQDQDQQDQQNKDDQQQDDQNKDQQGDEQDKKDGQDDKQQGDQKPGDENKDDQKQGEPRPNKMSREDAERLLKALERDEEDLQEKMNAKRVKTQPIKTEKDW